MNEQKKFKTITDLQKKIKMPKTDPKKVPSQKFVFARTSRYNDPTFYEKKFSHFTIPLIFTFRMEVSTFPGIGRMMLDPNTSKSVNLILNYYKNKCLIFVP